MPRDDFSALTKRRLAKRAGFKCSFPGCNRSTIGPSEEGNTAVSNTGIAAHISAASSGQGARRYDPEMTPSERSSIENGIWMCELHAGLIDTDEVRFTTKKLKRWKHLAEVLASFGMCDRSELLSDWFACSETEINGDVGFERKIEDFITDLGLVAIFGYDYCNSIRDLCVELCDNTLKHSCSESIRICFEHSTLSVFAGGEEFSFDDLLDTQKGGGGAATIEIFQDMYGSQVLLSHSWDQVAGNVYKLILYAGSNGEVLLTSLMPCVSEATYDPQQGAQLQKEWSSSCKRKHVVIRFNPCISHYMKVLDSIKNLGDSKCDYWIHIFNVSGVLKQYIKRECAGFTVRYY